MPNQSSKNSNIPAHRETSAMVSTRLIFTAHAIKRMHARKITIEEIRQLLLKGEVIENYPDDKPFPSRLVSGMVGSRPIHVVAAENNKMKETIIVSVYEPNIIKWDPYFKKRRKQ